ncbi:MAG TPA: DUF4440 domain-containing protein [Pyrinomonadaceae bacterium]|nr:DUF4440 domain-containing protein [Pyrinomonadaceae bacterium]
MKRISVLLLLCLLASFVVAQEPQGKPALEAMVETERAFAKMSADQGTRPAFVAFIADDGVIFRPNAVPGKQWFKEHPLPPANSEKRPLLSWFPAVAGMARFGDMGYTTGPWEFRSDLHDDKAVAWGTFLTVWKKQPDGQWRFAIDLGISNPQPTEASAPWSLPKDYKAPNFKQGQWTINAAALRTRDEEFSRASATVGARKAFPDFAAADVRVYREGSFPVLGQAAGVAALPERANVWTWTPTFSDVSNSDDLGYTYGTYKITTGENVVESGNYLRIWRKDGGKWKVLVDLTNPVPPPKKD